MIVGISGKIGCGKTFLAQHLQNLMARSHAFGGGVPVLRAFGDPLKIEVARTFGFPLAWCYSTEGKAKVVDLGGQARERFPEDKATVREIMQWWGTDVRREQDKDYWVKAFDAYVEVDLFQGNDILVPDARFPNEADWVIQHGGIMLRLNPYNGWVPGKFAGHESETALDEYKRFSQVLAPGYGRIHLTAQGVFRMLQRL